MHPDYTAYRNMKYTKMDEYLQSNDLEKLHEENVNRWIGGIHLQQSERAEDLLEYLTNIRFA